jgi:hypothetical protein
MTARQTLERVAAGLLGAQLLLAPACTRSHEQGARGERREAAPSPGSTSPEGRSEGSDLDSSVRALLSASSRAEADASPVPILVPRDPELARAAQVTQGPRWGAASIRAGELTISIHATNLEHPPDPDDPPQPVAYPHVVRGEPASLLRNEEIVSVGWVEDGVAYALEVECFDALTDVRCTEDAYVLALAARLVRVGGGTGAGGAR